MSCYTRHQLNLGVYTLDVYTFAGNMYVQASIKAARLNVQY